MNIDNQPQFYTCEYVSSGSHRYFDIPLQLLQISWNIVYTHSLLWNNGGIKPVTSWHGIKALLSIDAWLEADGLLLAMYLIVQPQMVALHALMLVTSSLLCFPAFPNVYCWSVPRRKWVKPRVACCFLLIAALTSKNKILGVKATNWGL